jgi:glycerol-3-phosphate dehydrogenase (NAD(P)+)
MKRIGVIGGGAWGTALAALSASNDPGQGDTLLWARNAEVVDNINAQHRNTLYLPDVELPANLKATSDLAALKDCDALVLAVPAQTLRTFAQEIWKTLPGHAPLVIAAKGVEIGSGKLPGEVLHDVLPARPVAILTGPTFASEVARGLPAAATLACADATLGAALVQRLGRPTFRPYLSDDVTGAQIGGAVKNVLAIACGIVMGRKLGDNARAALITRGLAEMSRLGLSLGETRDADGPLGPGRSGADLHRPAIAQPVAGHRPGRGQKPGRGDGRPAHRGRRRAYRAGHRHAGARPSHRDADLPGGGCRAA